MNILINDQKSIKITIGSVCFIQDIEHKKTLFLKRNKSPMQGLYTGVGGKTLYNEDIYSSCLREIKEETNLNVKSLSLKGVVKTIHKENNSSWLLFIYLAKKPKGKLINSNEGDLFWINNSEINNLNLIGFIRNLMPHIINGNKFVEGILIHDSNGNVLEENLMINDLCK